MISNLESLSFYLFLFCDSGVNVWMTPVTLAFAASDYISLVLSSLHFIHLPSIVRQILQ